MMIQRPVAETEAKAAFACALSARCEGLSPLPTRRSISASEIYDWCYARRRLVLGKSLMTRHRYSVWRVLKALGAEPVGRYAPTGSHFSPLFPGFVNHTKVDSLASVTGRLGYAWDRFLGM